MINAEKGHHHTLVVSDAGEEHAPQQIYLAQVQAWLLLI